MSTRSPKRRSLVAVIGLAGVADDETPAAQRWGRYFEAPMLVLAIWIIVEWYLSAKNAYPPAWETATNWIIWVFFVFETVLLTLLVRDRPRYLLTNWINLVIIAGGIPLLWNNRPYAGALRTLRILLLFRIFADTSKTLRQVLARNNIGLTLLVSLLIIVMAGTSIAAIDPAIDTAWDGIWWAWVTVTTVGYGDIVPESPQGRIFGGLLMVLGLGLFSLMTASFSAFLISREEEEVLKREEEIIKKEEEVIEKEEQVIGEEILAAARLEKIDRRLRELEKTLNLLATRLREKTDEEGEDPGSRTHPPR